MIGYPTLHSYVWLFDYVYFK